MTVQNALDISIHSHVGNLNLNQYSYTIHGVPLLWYLPYEFDTFFLAVNLFLTLSIIFNLVVTTFPLNILLIFKMHTFMDLSRGKKNGHTPPDVDSKQHPQKTTHDPCRRPPGR